MFKSIPPEAKTRLGESAQKHFEEDLAFAVVGGSSVYGGATPESDIDVVVVLKQAPDKRNLIERARGFIRDYVLTHQEHGFTPDYTFPTEIISMPNVSDAIAYRGFELDNRGNLTAPIPVSDEDYFAHRDLIYPVWLSLLAFNEPIAGDPEVHSKIKSEALDAILRFVLLNINSSRENTNKVLGVNTIMQNLIERDVKPSDFGIDRRYLNFRIKETARIRAGLNRLRARKLLKADKKGYKLDENTLGQWQGQTVKRLWSASSEDQTPYVFTEAEERELSDYAKSLPGAEI